MKFLVQKFGGTSLVTDELRTQVANKIIAARKQGYAPVVVVSAIGRDGEPYATDTLINYVRNLSRDVSPREMDLLMSCGEIISGVIMAAKLQSMGQPAVFLTGAQAGIITDDNFSDARVLKIRPEILLKYIQDEKIVVVAGFQGISEEGEITTLGRGGSDTTAAALGVALNAACVDIYTDVEGIMTADPRIVSDAKIRDMVTYEEICQLAHEGAQVVHPRAVEIVMQKNIPMRIKSTFIDKPGTLVTSKGEVYKGAIDITRDRVITGITQISNIVQIKIMLDDLPEGLKQQRRIFNSLALAGISIDFINVFPEFVAFTVKDKESDRALQVLENTGFSPEIKRNCAKVSAVGAGMTGVPGVMAGIVEALTLENIRILQANDSHATIWVLVEKDEMEGAVRALHKRFLLLE